jgi:AAA family ATP:ADP antiporter
MIGGVALNWIDVYWKGQLKIFFAGDKGGYNGFMGWFSGATGSLSLLFMVVGYFILRKCTWFTAAVIVPVVILISGSVFFIILLGADALQPVLTAFNLTTNAGIVYGGAAALILSKAVISAFFSPTKEMAYIPLPSEVKSKGRVIVDLCAGRLSKTAGACVYAMLLVASAASDVAYLIPYAFGAFVSLCLGWICVVKMLNHKIITALAGPERQG